MEDQHRLPRDVVPRHYRLILEPDLDTFTFAGTVAIDVDVVESTDRVVVNAAELDIDWATITAAGGAAAVPQIDVDREAERATLSTATPLDKGSAVIELSFRGTLNDQLRGFYRSTYRDDAGDEHVIATTQFQSTDARRAFPCWDEPDLKASFAVTLTVAPDHLAVSNTSELGRERQPDGRVSVHFADTIPMSTYLVAFVVGPLEVTDPVDVDGVPLRIVHRPGRSHLTGFALEVAAAALRHYVDYYDLPYPGDKLDMIAIPDFAFGAMENLGCVTYREVLLLIDPEAAAQAELQRVADVVNHELAHMWFGDLVTMRWWNGIWLNEAFATFMETRATDAFRPDWDRWTDFGLSRSMAFDVDSLRSTRPVEYPVHSPADAEGMFDVLTYEKGAAVVRMLEQYLGEDTFRDGVRHYLRRHQLGNTDTDDLWTALAEVSGAPVGDIMREWIFQGGYPLVSYTRTDAGVGVDQERFGYGPTEPTRWRVPLGWALGDRAGHELLHAPLELPIDDAVPRLNVGGAGFYRVALDDQAVAAVSRGDIGGRPAVERYAVVDDSWALVLAGRFELASFVAMLSGFVDDAELAVWQRIAGSLGALWHVAPDDCLGGLSAQIVTLFEPLADRLGRAASGPEPDRTRQLRALALTTLGTIGGQQPLVEWAQTIEEEGSDDPELATAAVGVLAHAGDAAMFDHFWSRFQDAGTPQEERRYLDALADFDRSDVLARLCPLALGDDIRSQDGPYVLGRALTNRRYGPMVWEYLTEHWSAVNDRFPSNSIARMLGGIRALSHGAVAEQVAAFLADHPVPQGELMVAQHLERLDVNVGLRARVAHQLPAIVG